MTAIVVEDLRRRYVGIVIRPWLDAELRVGTECALRRLPHPPRCATANRAGEI